MIEFDFKICGDEIISANENATVLNVQQNETDIDGNPQHMFDMEQLAHAANITVKSKTGACGLKSMSVWISLDCQNDGASSRLRIGTIWQQPNMIVNENDVVVLTNDTIKYPL